MNIKIEGIKTSDHFRKDLGDIDDLAASLEELGLITPVILDENNNLIAGRRRLAAAVKLGWTEIRCDIISLEAIAKGERDDNVKRKEYTPTEMVAIVEAVEEWEKREAKGRQKLGKGADGSGGRGKKKNPSSNSTKVSKKDSRSKTKAAKAVGTTYNTLAKAQDIVAAVKEEPNKYKEIAEEMDRTGNVSAAHKEYVRRQQSQIAAEKAKDIIDENILVGDFREQGQSIDDGSVSLIFTDPPYSKDKIDLFGDLGEFACRVLKDGGSLLTFAGQYAIPQVMEQLGRSLNYWWIICCKHEGASARLFGWHVRVAWKPILWFVKGKLPAEYPMVTDFIQSKKPDKQKHEWAQSIVEAKYYIEQLSYKDELVCDPFMGSGVTCIAAKELGRKYIGIEIDKEKADIGKVNIHGY